ncbi:MAG: iron ABC transporter permease [Lachnospiraceae bacterium]|nr:iron ABC transporter permease [Lachnospiraceae bacterium]MBR0402845.1 iron ABC transporter permease [Lachnospiraceae bacterium]MCR5538765.1 iron ABC transporter permease [Lachnospiraceae bacterium]
MKKSKITVVYIVLIALIILLAAVNIASGSVNIPLREVFEILAGRGTGTNVSIVMTVRFPRALAALLLGGALALSGYCMQTFFHNPIAGPFLLGISSGSKLTVSLFLVFLAGGAMGSFAFMIIAAFIGALAAMSCVLGVSTKVKRMSILLVCGVMIGYICSAITDFVVTFADDSNIVNLRNWSLGSLSGIGWDKVACMAVLIIICAVLVFMLSKPMAAYAMGENYAKSMGVNVKVFRVELILLSSLLAAVVTAFAGPISFVGIAVPHLVKSALKTTKPVVMIPACFLGGSVFCLFADLLARRLFAPTELSISTVTAVFGAPVVIYMLVKRAASRS